MFENIIDNQIKTMKKCSQIAKDEVSCVSDIIES
jgi:hypothetical protein